MTRCLSCTPASRRSLDRSCGAMTLDGDDVEAIARRVAALIAPSPRRLVDAAELAEHLGVKRGWVYAHAAVLGGVRLGGGPACAVAVRH